MTSLPSPNEAIARRRYLALAVTLAAAVASAASLDTEAPLQSYTASSQPQLTVLTPGTGPVTSTVLVTATNGPFGVELSVNGQVSGGGIAVPQVTATIGPDQGNQTDAGVPPDKAGAVPSGQSSATLAVAAGHACEDDPCTLSFALTFSEVPSAEQVSVAWTAVATDVTREGPSTITVTVTP